LNTLFAWCFRHNIAIVPYYYYSINDEWSTETMISFRNHFKIFMVNHQHIYSLFLVPKYFYDWYWTVSNNNIYIIVCVKVCASSITVLFSIRTKWEEKYTEWRIYAHYTKTIKRNWTDIYLFLKDELWSINEKVISSTSIFYIKVHIYNN
jgi:hypothetical protein